ncbi:MAG: hypothetical protein ACI3XI_03850 [Eubacteriales bacterium]
MKRTFAIFLTVFLLALSACSPVNGTQDTTFDDDFCGGGFDYEYWNKQFRYTKNTSPSIDLFIDWLESGGTLLVNEKNYSEHDNNNAILDWAASQGKILIPKSTDSTMTFDFLITYHYKNEYCIRLGNEEKNTWITVSFFPLTAEQSDADLWTLVQELITEGRITNEITCQKGNCEKWGEYVYYKYVDNTYDGTFIIYENYLLFIRITNDAISWSPDNLNLVDFFFVPVNVEATDSSSRS